MKVGNSLGKAIKSLHLCSLKESMSRVHSVDTVALIDRDVK